MPHYFLYRVSKDTKNNFNWRCVVDKKQILEKLDIEEYYSSKLDDFKVSSSGQAKALCPFHDDTNPSLSVNTNTGQFNCFGCDKKGSIFRFHMDMYEVDYDTALQELAKKAGITTELKKRIVETYNYEDETGNLLYQVVRYDAKGFCQRRPNGDGGWIYDLKGVRLIPYNLPNVLNDDIVFICEGEKDAENIKRIGFTATCSPMGAGKWKPEYNKYFKDKTVIIFPHNDEAGEKHAQDVTRNLKGSAKSVKVVNLPDLPEKGDISNWLEEFDTIEEAGEQLIDLISKTPEWVSEERKSIIRIGDILQADSDPLKWIIKDLLPEGSITLLSAPPSHYKTWIALDIAKNVSMGRGFLGRATQTKKVYYIDRENPKAVLKSYSRKLNIPIQAPLNVWPSWAAKEPPVFYNRIYLELASEKPLIIFDSLIRFYPKGVNENLSTDMAPIMSFLKSLTRAGATVLVLHHKGKSEGSDYRGSSDILGGVDIAYSINKKDNSNLILKSIKSRYQMEKDIPVEIISDDINLRFEDATQKITQAMEKEELKNMEVIKGLIETMVYPKKTELIKKASADLDIAEDNIRSLLDKGDGQKWTSKKGGKRGAIHYKNI